MLSSLRAAIANSAEPANLAVGARIRLDDVGCDAFTLSESLGHNVDAPRIHTFSLVVSAVGIEPTTY
jgi:hypothetical protein